MILGAQHIRPAALTEFDQVAHLIASAHSAQEGGNPRYEPWSIKQRLNEAWAAVSGMRWFSAGSTWLHLLALAPFSFPPAMPSAGCGMDSAPPRSIPSPARRSWSSISIGGKHEPQADR